MLNYAHASISLSQISVTVKTAKEIKGDIELLTLRNTVETIVRYIIDCYGYMTGRGYDVELTSVTDDSGNLTVFGVDIAELKEEERPLKFGQVAELILSPRAIKDPNYANATSCLRIAFGDLREAIRSHSDTGMFCFRAVEDIRQFFVQANDGEDKKPSWKRLNQALRIDEEYTKALTTFATPQRHGERPFMRHEDRVLAMKRAWIVVDRFVVFVNRGLAQLPEKEFQLLSC